MEILGLLPLTFSAFLCWVFFLFFTVHDLRTCAAADDNVDACTTSYNVGKSLFFSVFCFVLSAFVGNTSTHDDMMMWCDQALFIAFSVCECVNTISSSACSRWNKSSQLLLQLIMSVLRVSVCLRLLGCVCLCLTAFCHQSYHHHHKANSSSTHTASAMLLILLSLMFFNVCVCVSFSPLSHLVYTTGAPQWCWSSFRHTFHFYNQNILWRPLWRQNRGFRKMFTSLIFLSLTVQNRK